MQCMPKPSVELRISEGNRLRLFIRRLSGNSVHNCVHDRARESCG